MGVEIHGDERRQMRCYLLPEDPPPSGSANEDDFMAHIRDAAASAGGLPLAIMAPRALREWTKQMAAQLRTSGVSMVETSYRPEPEPEPLPEHRGGYRASPRPQPQLPREVPRAPWQRLAWAWLRGVFRRMDERRQRLADATECRLMFHAYELKLATWKSEMSAWEAAGRQAVARPRAMPLPLLGPPKRCSR